ncbi:HDOD domain-containing protein [Aurantivibrio infirmus]
MPLPTSVKNILDLQNVRYNIAELTVQNLDLDSHPITDPKTTVRSVLLRDGLGKVQVLYPSNCLLDLASLNQQLVRQLRAATAEDLQSFYKQHQLETVPALPSLGGFPTVVDEHLFNAQSLLLDSGINGQLLEIDQSDFQQVVSSSTPLNFCIPIDDLVGPLSSDDESEIFSAVKSFTSLRIQQRLEETLELPPLPATAQRIIQLRADPNADISDLSNIVETDPSLAAQVVSWAASPYYSAPGKIKSIHDAIVRVLGFDMVLNLALGLALGKTLKFPKDYPNGVNTYWQDAVFTAATIESLVTAIPKERRPSFGMSYLSGLLNNFGFLILAEIFPPQFELLNRYIEVNPHVPVNAIEQHIMNVTREQLAGWLMMTWQMPSEVSTALRYQSIPQFKGEHNEYAKLLFIAKAKLRDYGIGSGPKVEIPEAIYTSLGLDPELAENAVVEVMKAKDDLSLITQQLNT